MVDAPSTEPHRTAVTFVLSVVLLNIWAYKNYYISKIWGFHRGDYEECRLLGCYAVWLL
jgi:hypothetical protein